MMPPAISQRRLCLPAVLVTAQLPLARRASDRATLMRSLSHAMERPGGQDRTGRIHRIRGNRAIPTPGAAINRACPDPATSAQ